MNTHEDDVAHAVAKLVGVVGDAERDPVSVYQAIADEALASFEASSTSVWLPGRNPVAPRSLNAIVIAGDVSPDILRVDLPIEGTLLGRAFKDQASMLVEDFTAPDVPAVSRTVTQVFNFRSAMVLPLQCRGVLTILSSEPRRFSAEDISLAECFAALASAAWGLSGRAMAVERERLMTELHDGAIQVLYGALIEGELGLEAKSFDDLKTHLSEATTLVREGLTELRGSVMALDTAQQSLFQRIRHSANLLGKRTFVVTRFEGEDLGPDDPCTEDLFRIQLEAMSNAIRHGKASTVTITVANSADRLALEVADDGDGFDPESDDKGLGLVNMPRRADRIGATFTVESTPGEGTTIRVSIDRQRR